LPSERDPVIVAARRTAIGTRGRALAHTDVSALAAPVIRAVIADGESASRIPVRVTDVLLGNCMGPGGNPARSAALAAGLDARIPGGTIDRQCGSGLAAIIDAASAIRAGDDGFRIAGGVESASTAPVRSIAGVPYVRARFAPDGFPDPDMLRAAEDLAVHDGILRFRQDAHAARSHARARAAQARGVFDAETVPVAGATHDDGPCAIERMLPRFAPLFPGGSVTAGTATRIGDGAAAVLLAPGGTASGLAVRASAVIGCDPALPGIGAADAIQELLSGAGVRIADIAAFEIVEAFAVQSLAVLDRLGIADDDPRVCADGGALALGHPWGASAAISVVRLFSRLVRREERPGSMGVAAASVGGGLGVAALLEVVR
jgi:acetyl-CoA C-acetyltransferase